MGRKIGSAVIVGVLLFSVTGCVSMSRHDRIFYREIQTTGLDIDVHAVKSPVLAAILNILPGFGNFYLAGGTEESSQWAFGTLNLIFWPWSVPFAIPEAAIDAVTINKKEAVHYYRYDHQGKAEFDAAQLGRPLY